MSSKLVSPGKTAINLPLILRRCWGAPFATRSDFARTNAEAVAACASMGWLTNRTGVTQFERQWRITPAGLSHLWTLEGFDE